MRELEGGSLGSFLWFHTLICKGSYSQATMDTFLTSSSLHTCRWSWAPKGVHMNRNGKGWRRTLPPRCPHTADGGNCQCRPKSKKFPGCPGNWALIHQQLPRLLAGICFFKWPLPAFSMLLTWSPLADLGTRKIVSLLSHSMPAQLTAWTTEKAVGNMALWQVRVSCSFARTWSWWCHLGQAAFPILTLISSSTRWFLGRLWRGLACVTSFVTYYLWPWISDLTSWSLFPYS